MLATRGQNNNYFWPRINFGHVWRKSLYSSSMHFGRRPLMLAGTPFWPALSKTTVFHKPGRPRLPPAKKNNGLVDGRPKWRAAQMRGRQPKYGDELYLKPWFFRGPAKKLFELLAAFWTRWPKQIWPPKICTIGHYEYILATRDQNNTHFWPRINFGGAFWPRWPK